MSSDCHSYPDRYSRAFAFSDILYQLNHRCFLRFTAQSHYWWLGLNWLTTFRHKSITNLAAYYRPRSFVSCEEVTPNPLLASVRDISHYLCQFLRSFRCRFRYLRRIRYLALSQFRLPGDSKARALDSVRICTSLHSLSLFIQRG